MIDLFFGAQKRTGPDLARVGNYRTADWHENHMWDPTSVVPDSIMPSYKHMFKNNADIETAYAEALTVKKKFSMFLMMQKMEQNLVLGRMHKLK